MHLHFLSHYQYQQSERLWRHPCWRLLQEQAPELVCQLVQVRELQMALPPRQLQ